MEIWHIGIVIVSYYIKIPNNFTFHSSAQYELFIIIREERGKTNQGGKDDTGFYHLIKIKNNFNINHSYVFSKNYSDRSYHKK